MEPPCKDCEFETQSKKGEYVDFERTIKNDCYECEQADLYGIWVAHSVLLPPIYLNAPEVLPLPEGIE